MHLSNRLVASELREAFAWVKRPVEHRRELAKKILVLIQGHAPKRTQSDPFLTLRIYNRLVNGSETPEGIGFEWSKGEYRLANPEAIHCL